MTKSNQADGCCDCTDEDYGCGCVAEKEECKHDNPYTFYCDPDGTWGYWCRECGALNVGDGWMVPNKTNRNE